MKWQEITALVSAVVAVMSVTIVLHNQLSGFLIASTSAIEARINEERRDNQETIRLLYDYMLDLEIRVRELETEQAKNWEGEQ